MQTGLDPSTAGGLDPAVVAARRNSASPVGARLHPATIDASAMTAMQATLAKLATTGGADALHGLTLVDVRSALGGQVARFRLGNGMQLIALSDAGAKLLAYHTWVRVGSAHEEEGKTGLAHLLEHMMFKASAKFPAGAFDRVLERMGASPNAATWLDWTMYHQTILGEALATVAAMEADRLCFLKLAPAALRSELDVVRSERREVVDTDPDGRVEEAFAASLWGKGVGYGHPTVGRGPDLRKMTTADVLGFYRRWYQPGRAAVVLVGAIDFERDLPLWAAAYGPLPAQAVGAAAVEAQAAPVAALLTQKAPAEIKLDAGADRLLVGWRAMPGDHVDHPVLALVAELLADADVARLQRALVEDARLALDVDVDASSLSRGGALELRVRLRPGVRAEAALARVDAELKDLLASRPFVQGEIDGARNRLRAGRLASMTTVDGRAEALGHDYATFEEPTLSEAWWRRLETATLADVQRVTKAVLRDDQRVVVIGRGQRAASSDASERR